MGVMAVCTNCSVCISSRQGLLMNTIQGFLILLSMTFLTGEIHFKGKITRAARGHFGMWKSRNICMAIHTGDFFRSMHRGREMFCSDGQWNSLSPNLSSHTRLLMTG